MCAFEPADQSLKNRLYGKHLDSTNPKVAKVGGGNLTFFCRILGYLFKATRKLFVKSLFVIR